MKVLYHIDNPAKWKLTMENIKNMIKEGKKSGETFDIEILPNSVSVIKLKEQIAVNSKLYMEMSDLASENVKFKACNNSVNTITIKPEELCSFVEIVPSGVVEVGNK